MKYFIVNMFSRVLLVVGFLAILFGCESSLTTSPADQYEEEMFFKNSEEVEAGLTAVYEVLRGYHSDLIFMGDILSPNAVKFDDPGGWRSIARGNALTTNDLFMTSWTSNYRGIGRANLLLGNLDNGSLEEDERNRIEGEAKFLRAYFYSDLLNKFGGVPLILDPPDPSQGDLKRDSKESVLNQILDDLDVAISLLPEETNDLGRVTKGAALAYKARILLYHEQWDQAAKAAKEVIESGKYSLFPDYGELFKTQNENNQEVIWDIQFKLPRFNHNFVDEATVHANPAPLKGLIDAYLMKDGKDYNNSPLYSDSNPYENRDPRLYQTVRLVGSMFNGSETKDDDVPETFIGAKKWIPYDDNIKSETITAGLSEGNAIVIRYAEVLLTFAEAQNEASGPDPSVYSAINNIRGRESVNMPSLQNGMSKDEMREVIRRERRIELAMEGYYYNDIRRWGTATDVMNGSVYDFYGDVYENRAYEAPKNNLWAIPSDEIDLNPNLEQNSGW